MHFSRPKTGLTEVTKEEWDFLIGNLNYDKTNWCGFNYHFLRGSEKNFGGIEDEGTSGSKYFVVDGFFPKAEATH